ncbi:MAG: NUMOD4 domain-containing protein [Candidatus Kapaibacterium sp.]
MNKNSYNGLESKCNPTSNVIDKPFTVEAFIFNKMEEIWKSIKGYEGFYEVSNLGRVKSLERRSKWKNSSVRTNEKILKQCFDSKKYLMVLLTKETKKKFTKVSRLVAIAFIPNPENKPQVNHIDGIKINNNVENLEWCTNQENIWHAFRTGLMNSARGEGVSLHKLKEIDINRIRKMADSGYFSLIAISKIYNVYPCTIRCVVIKKTWKHIPYNSIIYKSYYPSNGTDGLKFTSKYCDKCYKINQCTILVGSLIGKQPRQWVYKNGEPICTSFDPNKPKTKKKLKIDSSPKLW